MNFYWEMSAIEPHRVLEDLIRILHPEALPEGKLYFYKEVN
jgi:iron complex transport system substrate-binding protein